MNRSMALSVMARAVVFTVLAACAACSSAPSEGETDDAPTESALVTQAGAPAGGDDTTCSSIILVSANLERPTDATSQVSVIATIDVAKGIAVAKAGIKIAARAYNVQSGNNYVSSGDPLSREGTWVSAEAAELFTPDTLPAGMSKVGVAPSGFSRLTFRVTKPATAFENAEFAMKDVSFNQLRFDLVPFVTDKEGVTYTDKNYNHGKYDSMAKEIPTASLSQLSGFNASDSLYCCTSAARSSCIHDLYPSK